MTPDTVITIGQNALLTMLMIAAPPLLAALAVGLRRSRLSARQNPRSKSTERSPSDRV